MRELTIVRKEEQVVSAVDVMDLAREYVMLREMKKEIEERMKVVEEILRNFTEKQGNLLVDGYEIGWFIRKESEVVDMRKFLEIAILKGVAEKVLRPAIVQVRNLKIKELVDLLIEKEKKVFSVKKQLG